MENEILSYELYRLEVIKGRVLSIIGRVIATIILIFSTGMYVGYKNMELSSIILICICFYVLVSDTWLCIKATGNWIIGIIAFIVMIFAFAKLIELGTIGNIVGMFLLVGIFFIDIYNIFMYIKQKTKVVAMGIKMRKISRKELKYYKNYYKGFDTNCE